MYSGGGTSIVQLLIEEVAERPYPEVMNQYVLLPLGMTNSCFEQPPSDFAVERGVGHDTEGRQLADGWHVYPEMAAAGLWTTPTDLARFFLALIRSRNEQPSPVVESIARLLTEPVLTQLSSSRDVALDLFSEEPGSNERAVGLGTFFERRNAKWTFGHPGCNHGYRALARASLDDGFGHVIMVNSDNGDALIDEVDKALMSCH